MEFMTTDLKLDLIVMNSLWTFLQLAVWLDGSAVQTSEVIQQKGLSLLTFHGLDEWALTHLTARRQAPHNRSYHGTAHHWDNGTVVFSFSTCPGRLMAPRWRRSPWSWRRRGSPWWQAAGGLRCASATAAASPSATSSPSWAAWASASPSASAATSVWPSWRWSTTTPSMSMGSQSCGWEHSFLPLLWADPIAKPPKCHIAKSCACTD